MIVDCPACETVVQGCSSAGRVRMEGPLPGGLGHKAADMWGRGGGRAEVTSHVRLLSPGLSIWRAWVWPGGRDLSAGRAAVVTELRMLPSPRVMVEKKSKEESSSLTSERTRNPTLAHSAHALALWLHPEGRGGHPGAGPPATMGRTATPGRFALSPIVLYL